MDEDVDGLGLLERFEVGYWVRERVRLVKEGLVVVYFLGTG